ncbi:type II toxin-antitoxin system PemK/MazF family toxin [Oscillatoria sp. CS-180]|uniref:type II toxin-antitoxin system PemK/MazF family toxin n=1 Tax=Oscillatoria sp. CS-180 TaxID=3021720 RepID=UPI00232DF8A6|nr:type II toxin-antitoxin system PemK/MazF family toxin [Oscillatoria sp. CS-180]MDB9527155.1 type II toxin-antitoxin system PemK/MazF family toxin [Oscillatoria sp. CS-180]
MTKHRRSLVTLVPHTSSRRGSRFEVAVRVRFLKPGVFDVQNLVTVAHAKLLRKLGDLDSEQLSLVEDALLFWLGFEDDAAVRKKQVISLNSRVLLSR